MVAGSFKQTCFVKTSATIQSHADDEGLLSSTFGHSQVGASRPVV